MKRILFLTQGDIYHASSQRRVYQYLPLLEKAGHEVVVHPAITHEESQFKGKGYFSLSNWKQAFQTFTRRVNDLHQLRDFDFVFVQRPILPAPFFNMEARIMREAKMIFDFDEAIFERREGSTAFHNQWPQTQRVASTCRRASRVVVGNEHLAQFVRKAGVGINPILIPTGLDLDSFTDSSKLTKHAHKIPVVGIAENTTEPFDLDIIIPALIHLHSKTPFVFRILGGVSPIFPARFPVERKRWNLETEGSDIAHLDYGLAPMHDTPWNRGYCGLKVIQYWAAGVPAIASPVGIYRDLIREGENGFLASTHEEWTEKILALVKNPELRRKVVAGGHKTVREKFSLPVLAPRFLSLFDEPEKS